MTEELWQQYSEQGMPLPGKGMSKEAARRGLLHSAAHVWIWRIQDNEIEVLLQKRANNKGTWPGLFDISAAGHIDLGEDPLAAAVRETSEELGITVSDADLKLFSVQRAHLTSDDIAENEFQWLYLLQLTEDPAFTLQQAELDSVVWQSLEAFKQACLTEAYVPHSKLYYETVIDAIEQAADKK